MSHGVEFLVAIHGFSALVITALAIHVGCGWRGGLRGFMLFSWMAASALWALANTALAARPNPDLLFIASLLDVSRMVLAGALLVVLMGGVRRARSLALVLACLAALAFMYLIAESPGARHLAQIQLALAVVGLAAVESFWRSLALTSRWAAKPICLALCAGFAFDVYAQAEAALLGRITADMWVVRALVAALCMPLAWLFAARAPQARVAVSLSRGAFFHSTALAASGAYLMLMSAAGFYVRDFGGQWGPALQLVLVFAGVLLFAVFASSAGLRARSRLFLARHFFKLRYDYRETWLGLTHTLSQAHGFSDSAERVVAALCALVESPGGVLCWANEAGDFEARVAHRIARPNAIEPARNPLIEQWTREPGVWLLNDPGQLSAFREVMPRAWLAVPLVRAGVMKGFVVLTEPRTPVVVDWEVRDALTTACAQAVTDLCHWQAFDALLAARKFESANRLATFALHDFKNCVAELSLLASNAQRHGAKPEFQQDMIHTLHHVASRMHALMDSLKQGIAQSESSEVELADLLHSLTRQMAMQQPAPQLRIDAPGRVRADVTILARVIGHLMQNAIDATDAAGRVWVNLGRDDQHLLIEIHDTGQGMTEDFLRDRFFKPFQTTKPQGMGVGAYEAHEYIRALGGRLDVASTPGEGTSITVRLPALAKTLSPTRVAA